MAHWSADTRWERVIAYAILTFPIFTQNAWAQPARAELSMNAQPVVQGIYNWIHSTGDAERAFLFYQNVFGVELAASPFGRDANAPPEGIRPVAEAGSDSLVWNLTNTAGSRFRTVFMRTANTPFGLELSEFFDIPRSTRAANPWDPGASELIFKVRDLNTTVTRLGDIGAPAVTLGGMPLDTSTGRSILVRDPDGYLVRAIQASPTEIAGAALQDDVISTSIGISVADTPAALAFYRDLLGFEVRETNRAQNADLRLYGLNEGELIQTKTIIPGTAVSVLLSEFSLPGTSTQHATPFDWKIQDVGAPQFQLQVIGLDALLDRTRQAGYRFLSVNERPIQRPFGRFVFVIDADGVLVEYVEPAANR